MSGRVIFLSKAIPPRPPPPHHPTVVRPDITSTGRRSSKNNGGNGRQTVFRFTTVVSLILLVTCGWWRYQIVFPPSERLIPTITTTKAQQPSSAKSSSSWTDGSFRATTTTTKKWKEQSVPSSLLKANATSNDYCRNMSTFPSSCPHIGSTTLQQSSYQVVYPRRFFEQGAGNPWLEQVQATWDDLNVQSRFLWYRPTIPLSQVVMDGDTTAGRTTATAATTRTTTITACCPVLVYYHIHKNGGGSMAHHVPLEMDAFNADRERAMGHDEYTKECQHRMQQVYDHQQQQQQETSIIVGPQSPIVDSIFTFLRDPVERFLSSLGQVLNGPMGLIQKHISPCHNSMTTVTLVECVLDKMESSSSSPFFLDRHFVPQSYELYSGVLGYDIGIIGMDLRKSLPEIVQRLGGLKHHKPINSAVGTKLWRFPQFQPLSLSILTSTMTRRICTLYQADVVLLRETGGVTTTSCSTDTT